MTLLRSGSVLRIPRSHDHGGSTLLLGRDTELARLDSLIANSRAGRSSALVVCGEAGIGKSAVLARAAARAAPHARVRQIVASESEMELAYAGLQQLCAPMMNAIDSLPLPQREALEVALGLSSASSGNRFLVGLAVRSEERRVGKECRSRWSADD